MEAFVLFVVITLIGLMLYSFQIVSVRQYVKRKDLIALDYTKEYPPVSILKPLKGLDDNLFDNLDSFCRLDYPQYEIIFALQDINDPAYKVVCKVKDRYPEKDIKIVTEFCNVGLNPKINNLIPAYRQSRYEFILISDSNVAVGSDYLKTIVSSIHDKKVGLVCNLIRGLGGRSIGAILENLHLNTFILGSVCFLQRYFDIQCVIGKSMLMRKSDLEAIGGLMAFKDILAEDYVIGREMKKYGKTVVVSDYMIHNVNEYWSLKRFLNRHTRWGKLRWKIGGYQYISELLCNPVFMSCIAFATATESRFYGGLFAFFVSGYKIMGDYYINRLVSRHQSQISYIQNACYRTRDSFYHYLFVPIKDIIIGLIWFVPLISSKVVWRGNKYLVGKDSTLKPYHSRELKTLRMKTRFLTS
ncbi:MAG: ceramide glucosyltransferase [Thermodesulfovibrionales bacterium]